VHVMAEKTTFFRPLTSSLSQKKFTFFLGV
jgi:hypothetical protein